MEGNMEVGKGENRWISPVLENAPGYVSHHFLDGSGEKEKKETSKQPRKDKKKGYKGKEIYIKKKEVRG